MSEPIHHCNEMFYYPSFYNYLYYCFDNLEKVFFLQHFIKKPEMNKNTGRPEYMQVNTG